MEASQLQKKLKKIEEKNHKVSIAREIEKRENKFIHLNKIHEIELKALQEKINVGKNEMIRAKEKDFESIQLKYDVLKKQQENEHRHEEISEHKRLKNFKPTSKYLLNATAKLE